MELFELRKQPHLSVSSVNDYAECGLLYKLGRIDKLPFEAKSDALEFGSVIHLVLAEFYEERMVGNKVLLKDLHESFEDRWRKVAEGNTNIEYANGKDFETLLMGGKDLLTTWYNKLPDDNFRVMAIEETFSFTIANASIPIIGAIDLIEEDESGTIIITDWKTSGRAYSTSEVDKNMQLTVYQMAVKANGFADREILLRFDTLIKTITPKFEQYWTTRTEDDERRVATKIAAAWDGISKGVFVPNDGSWRCKNCSFKKACDEWLLGGGKRE